MPSAQPQLTAEASASASGRAPRVTARRIGRALRYKPISSLLRQRIRRWTRKRHGIDPDSFILPARRIYILPTGLGITFGFMLFAMFLGAMNYGNNLALGLAFMLGALGLTAMHYCHRNLAALRIRYSGCEPVFAGQTARFRLALENLAPLPRYELTVGNEHGTAQPQRIEPGSRAILEVEMPAQTRGYLRLEYFELATRHPFGLFRAWSYLHMDLRSIVYPRSSDRSRPPPLLETDTGGAQDLSRGDDDFAGLRSFHLGDSPQRIAWKAYAREQGLQVKMYAGTEVTSHWFDWDALPGIDTEARLSQLCRWVEDAFASGRAFGLKLPGTRIAPNVGPAHRQRCLTALALFDLHEPRAQA
jgi:uncharacterized protein (DUF58 family)